MTTTSSICCSIVSNPSALAVGFDPSTEDMEQRSHPAGDMDTIYRLVGKQYSKSKEVVQETVKVLDYARLYLELPDRYASLKQLVTHLSRFLA